MKADPITSPLNFRFAKTPLQVSDVKSCSGFQNNIAIDALKETYMVVIFEDTNLCAIYAKLYLKISSSMTYTWKTPTKPLWRETFHSQKAIPCLLPLINSSMLHIFSYVIKKYMIASRKIRDRNQVLGVGFHFHFMWILNINANCKSLMQVNTFQ